MCVSIVFTIIRLGVLVFNAVGLVFPPMYLVFFWTREISFLHSLDIFCTLCFFNLLSEYMGSGFLCIDGLFQYCPIGEGLRQRGRALI